MPVRMLQYPLLTGLAIALPAMAWAAAQGTLGSTSTMSMTVSGNLAPSVRISNLNDINLGSFTGQAELQATQGLCVFVSNGGPYSIVFTGQNDDSSFRVADSYSHFVDYSVEYDNSGTGASYQAVSPGVTLSNLSGASSSSSCSGSTNANVRVTVYKASVTSPTGSYADTLSVTVAPN